MKKSKGFTLIEVVVVLAIIAAIAAFLTPMLFDYLKESKVSRAKNDVAVIGTAIANFNRDTQVYPVYNTDTTQARASVTILHSDEGNQATASDAAWNATATSSSTDVQTLDSALNSGTLAGGSILYKDKVKKPGSFKGPYLSNVKSDPWGNKYYVSTEGLQPGSDKLAFVLSAGPNATIETALAQSSTSLTVSGDDIVYQIK